VVSSTPLPHFTPRKDPVPILQETRWVPEPIWTGGNSRPRRDSILDRPARSQSLYRLSYPAHPRCPEGFRKLKFPDYVTMVQDGCKVVSLRHRPLLPPGNTPGIHFCWRLCRPQGHNAIGRIMSMKNSNDTLCNRTSDLPICSAAHKIILCSSIIQFSQCDISINVSVINNFWYGIFGVEDA